MEELTEVITSSSFHPIKCNEFVYSSSKGSIRLCDMREKALCDNHAKCEFSLEMGRSALNLLTTCIWLLSKSSFSLV